ncbi:hypothetical protein LU674_017450 [Pseudomonas alloputida]|uniref:DUF6957 domain-containing protein n=2 Tax=Pseudomonas TaxID=286 RepID=A0A7W2PS48_9PSED|nr:MULTISPECIES: hypothetical protein [Pseudomonas]MBA1216395.1 hypothetical protein [Pseudomonas fulva]MBA1319554.1 hypothetical protein [Pseudomonas monteilii]MBA6058776.1 hypothetical protein [Pseudomonas juntendi]MBA6105407.1 hypothetical protein [Pseudomonas monteilii]MBA6126009.1 hypothetical protein [Pseudomonas juntendi]
MAVTLEEVSEFFYGQGKVVSGWEGDDGELIELAQAYHPGKPYCLVRKWIVADLQLSQAELERLKSEAVQPLVLFAHEVVRDSRNRFAPGHWVRSNFGISHRQPCMFETRSTVYLLLGDGCRKRATLDTVFSLRP